MKSIKLWTKNISPYFISIVVCGLIGSAIYLNHQQTKVNEYFQFINAQLPSLKAENAFMIKEIKIAKKYSYSLKPIVEDIEPLVNYLLTAHPDQVNHQLTYYNNHLMDKHDMSNLLDLNGLKNLSQISKEALIDYRVTKFLNRILLQVSNRIGVFSSDRFSKNINLVDFRTRGNYFIYLDYKPEGYVETPMIINDKLRNDNSILFKPTKTGLHILDISFSQYDPTGNKTDLTFTKNIMVFP